MTADEAVTTVYCGGLVRCTAEEYHSAVRSALQDAAGRWVEQGQDLRAQIALVEVQRLDRMHGATRGG
jgi:hypothetical protein